MITLLDFMKNIINDMLYHLISFYINVRAVSHNIPANMTKYQLIFCDISQYRNIPADIVIYQLISAHIWIDKAPMFYYL